MRQYIVEFLNGTKMVLKSEERVSVNSDYEMTIGLNNLSFTDKILSVNCYDESGAKVNYKEESNGPAISVKAVTSTRNLEELDSYTCKEILYSLIDKLHNYKRWKEAAKVRAAAEDIMFLNSREIRLILAKSDDFELNVKEIISMYVSSQPVRHLRGMSFPWL